MIDCDILTVQGARHFLCDALHVTHRELDNLLEEMRGDEIELCAQAKRMIRPRALWDELRLHLWHVTTNTDECKSILTHGILGVRDVLTLSNELTELLLDCGVCYNSELEIVSVNGVSYPLLLSDGNEGISSSQPEIENLLYILRNDSLVNAFIHCPCFRRYSAITRYPEIICAIEAIVGFGNERILEWTNSVTPYLIEFTVRLDQLLKKYILPGEGEEFLWDDAADEESAIINRLIYQAFQVCVGSCGELYAFLPSRPGVSPTSIVRVIPLEKYCSDSSDNREPMCDREGLCELSRDKDRDYWHIVGQYGSL